MVLYEVGAGFCMRWELGSWSFFIVFSTEDDLKHIYTWLLVPR